MGRIGMWMILTPSGWEAGAATPFLLFLLFVIPGGALLLPCVRWVGFERRWLLWGGEIASGRRIRGGLIQGGRFRAVQHVDVRHGVWKTGTGCTDILRFYLYERSRPIAFATRESHSREVNPEILALGKLIASRVGRQVAVVTEWIKEPSSD